MKRIILLILLVLLFNSCITMVSDEKLDDWALNNDYIKTENIPELVVPEREALPHPLIPVFETVDEEGIPVPITKRYMMNMIIQLFGTVEKFQYLAEIYEREYLNSGGKIMPDLTLDELKALYEQRLSFIERTRDEMIEEVPEETEETTTSSTNQPNPYFTNSATPSDKMTIEQFEDLLKVWETFQENL